MASVKMAPQEESTDKIKNRYGTGNDLSHPQKSDIEHYAHDIGLSTMYAPADSFAIDRLFNRLPWPRRWSIAMIGVILLLFPIGLIWPSVGLEVLPPIGVAWFRPFFPPIVTIYILIAIQVLQRTRENVALSLRPLVQVDDETFIAVVRRACRANPVGELVGFGIGASFFLMIEGLFRGGPGHYWISLYYYLVSFIMFGAIGWSVYAVITITQLTNTLLRQPIEVDIFDAAPLEPIGMQSLYLSLALLGAAVLGLPSNPYPLFSWQNAVIYGVLILITVLVFFVNMYSTHRLLTSAKRRQIAIVEHKFAQSYRQLRNLAAGDLDTHVAATELNAWAVAKQELKLTRTWPYNTEILRTLFISIVIPFAVGLSRLVGGLIASGGF